VSYARLHKPSEAIQSYEQALEIDGNSLDALKGLCQSLLTADDEIAPPQVSSHTFFFLLLTME
jgi:cytochrome c-type biogenesis protein CcmH/NrfG